MSGLTLVETSQGVLAMGGYYYGEKKEIYKLNCRDDMIKNCRWREMEQKLAEERSNHVSIPLPESYDVCN